ncbi:hypothetical protein B0T24DRAFT_607933 [Lasiosphaeria ovina]|uniref:Uncharacterized protein n=1 Tax=Lasiosphaeria ovina TaxID=92902 RepID=A0AAE0NMN2_9PEZI|nr:hypothetical protein B0T24DRAFT_607933 [Lasiosphaeria ovina]
MWVYFIKPRLYSLVVLSLAVSLTAHDSGFSYQGDDRLIDLGSCLAKNKEKKTNSSINGPAVLSGSGWVGLFLGN